jgi:hypothetical protein
MTDELAEVLGCKRVSIRAGDQTLTLAPMTLNDMIAMNRWTREHPDADPIEFLRYQLWVHVRRAGGDYTEEQVGDLFGMLDMDAIEAVQRELVPPPRPQEGEAGNATSPAPGPGASSEPPESTA